MYWQAWSEPLRKQLSLDTHPIGLSLTGPAAAEATGGKVSVCQAVLHAAAGETVVITAETCGCAGGLVNLGLGQTSPQNKEKLVDFLVRREKVYCSRVVMHRSAQTVEPPLGVASRVVFAPLAKAVDPPDVVLFVARPGSAHQLVGLANYADGSPMLAELAGPMCRTGISYPLVTGEIGLSLFDVGARRLAAFGADQLLVGVPLHRMLLVMWALEQGSGGGHLDRDAMEKQIDELGKVQKA